MKKVFLFAAAVAMLAACSSNDDLVKEDVKQDPQAQTETGAIGFDVYTQKATTRAGWTGSLTTAELQINSTDDDKPYEHSNGFGVFGFYTDNNEYEQRSVPNFMYNQQVIWHDTGTPSTSYWIYEPIMYWPNEYGSNAESDDYDKVSFFAYAPYVEVVPTSGKLDKKGNWTDDDVKEAEAWGITGMTRNSNQGDPILKYIASFDNKKSVDLCWGVQPAGQWNTTQGGSSNKTLTPGLPWLNVQRPAQAIKQEAAINPTDQKVKFVFKHATAQMTIKIDADVNNIHNESGKNVDGKTRVWVRQVTFNGFALKGALNLNNETANEPRWLDYGGQNELVAEAVTIYDQRKDGKEGVSGAIATNEKQGGLNHILIQDEAYKNGGDVYGSDALTNYAGVTASAVNLFESEGSDEFFHVIPIEGEDFEVEIVYDIETVDKNLAQNLSDGATKGSSIENRISKKITFGSETNLEAGHAYTLNLHLGLNSVKFDAAVAEWKTVNAQDVDLPLNVPQYPAGATPASATYGNSGIIYLPYTDSMTDPTTPAAYTLAISGMDAGESVTGAETASQGKAHKTSGTTASATIDETKLGWTISSEKALMNGYAIETVRTTANPTTCNRSQVVTWTGGQSGKGATFTFTQQAHPLELYVTEADPAAATHNVYNINSKTGDDLKKFDLSRSGDLTAGFGWMCKGLADNCVKVDGDGTTATYGIPAGSPSYIKVWRNGTQLTWSTTLAAGTFTFSDTSGTITFNDELHAGDIFTITLKTGDAPEETISVKVVDTP